VTRPLRNRRARERRLPFAALTPDWARREGEPGRDELDRACAGAALAAGGLPRGAPYAAPRTGP